MLCTICPPGDYTVRVWHPLLDESGSQLSSRLRLVEGVPGSASFRLTRPLRPALHNHGADKKWEDY